jgi:hypothetical protein
VATLTLPETVEVIGTYALYTAGQLETLDAGRALREVEAYAFYGCSSLETVRYAGTEAEWAAVTVGGSNAALRDAAVSFGA